MSEPLVVSIPHRLGKEEAIRRLKSGLERATQAAASVVHVEQQRWIDNRLSFKFSALQQHASGVIEVEQDFVRVEVSLPWLLARMANGIKDTIAQRGARLLEKK
jgi:hypothetical protein